jgi:hypothetical protein
MGLYSFSSSPGRRCGFVHPGDNDPLDPLLSTVRYSWLIGGLAAKKVLVFIAELLVGKAWEGWCDTQMILGGGAAGTQMLRQPPTERGYR